MYNILVHAHSGLRWILLALLIISVVKAISGITRNKEFKNNDRLTVLITMIVTHIQLLIGLILYFTSPNVMFGGDVMSNSVLRFYTIEHIFMMLIAIVLITVGHSKAKRIEESISKHKKIALFYGIGLLIILAAIPWPFRELGAGWF